MTLAMWRRRTGLGIAFAHTTTPVLNLTFEADIAVPPFVIKKSPQSPRLSVTSYVADTGLSTILSSFLPFTLFAPRVRRPEMLPML